MGWLSQKYSYYRHRFFLNREAFGARGKNVILFNGSTLSPPRNIYFSSYIYVGPEAYWWADAGRIVIEDNVTFGPRTSITTTQHLWRNADFLPFCEKSEAADVVVQSHAWVGMGCCLLPGVVIGEGAICAAGAVIHRSVPPLAIVGGNPAQIRGWRDPVHYRRLRDEGKWWHRHVAEHFDDNGLAVTRYLPREEALGFLSESESARRRRNEYGAELEEFLPREWNQS